LLHVIPHQQRMSYHRFSALTFVVVRRIFMGSKRFPIIALEEHIFLVEEVT